MTRWLLRFALASAALVLVFQTALAQASKLDPTARIALARLTAGESAQSINDSGRLSVSPQGDLDVFILGNVSRQELEAAGARVRTALPGVFTAWLPADRVDAVTAIAGVTRIEGAQIDQAANDKGVASTGANLFRGGGPAFTGINGAGVIVSNVDTGVDYHHDDFKNALGGTRLLRIWDQTNAAGPAPAGFGYGTEWTTAQIDALISTAGDTNGHGSHTMGSAAGDGSMVGPGSAPAFTYAGMAPMADLIAVDGSVSGSFSRTQMVDGANYIFQQATNFGKNAVVNMSIGSEFGPKDGTDAFEIAIDAMSGPGKFVAMAAGNDHGLKIHAEVFAAGAGTSATMAVASASASPRFVVINGYYESTENLNVQITTPNGTVIGPVVVGATTPGAYPGPLTANGNVYIENGVSLTTTGDKQVYIELNAPNGAAISGTWTFTFIPVVLGADNGRVELWQVAFAAASADFVMGLDLDHEMVSALATGYKTASVAAWQSKASWPDCNGHPVVSFTGSPAAGNITNFSSPGPTRDGRAKPDIAAPGSAVVSARSHDIATACPLPVTTASTLVPGLQHVANQGTSMATPHVTGAVALFFQKYGALTPAQVLNLLYTRATVDGFVTGSGPVPNNFFGYGKLNVGDLSDPLCAVIAPNGGEVLAVGMNTNLQWSASDALYGVTSVDLELSRDGGSNWENIALGVPNTGSYAWIVTGPVTNSALLRATARDVGNNKGVDVSDNVWAITAPVGTVVSEFRTEPDANGIRLVWKLSDPVAFSRVAVERADAASGPWGEIDAELSLDGSSTVALDRSVQAGKVYYYRLDATYRTGGTVTFGPISASMGEIITKFELDGVSPNPTPAGALIEYAVPRATDVSVSMFDLQGREVATLASGHHPPGRYQVTWSGEVDGGPARSGVYFVRMRSPEFKATRRVVVSH